MENQYVSGANCFNCLYISKNQKPVNPEDLNKQGGIDPITQENLQKAKRADLITLPGETELKVEAKRFCYNVNIEMFVTERMVCSYWDNKGVKRPWDKKGIWEPEYLGQMV